MNNLPDPHTINFMIDIAELAVTKRDIEMGMIKPFLSLREAQRKFGVAIVNRWIKERLVIAHKDGNNNSKIRIDRLQIEAVAKASNRGSYLNTEERKK